MPNLRCLQGKHVLVVETERLIAHDIERIASDHGAGKITLVHADKGAAPAASATVGVDLAVMDFRAARQQFRHIAGHLSAMGVPTIIMTTGGENIIRPWLIDRLTTVEKPFGDSDFSRALSRLGFLVG